MRKALFGLLMATALAAPAMAQEAEVAESTHRQVERHQEASDGQVQREAQRFERRAERAQQRLERQSPEPRAQRRQERIERIERGGEDGERILRREQRQERREDRQEQRAAEQNTEVRNVQRERRREGRTQRVDPAELPENIRRQEDRDYRAIRQEDRRGRIERRVDRREDRRWNDGGSHWGNNSQQRQWDRRWRQNNRYAWQRYRYTNRSVFRPGPYYSPYRNHGYSRFSIGITLGRGYFSNRYWINDPWQYRLPEAYPGTRWVRYYNDMLLVDVFNGRVVDVIHGFFW